jgi:hypothetical protein
MKNNTYTLRTEDRMDISFTTYFSTVSLGLMCYSFFNPGFVFDLSIFLAYGFVKTMFTSYNIFNTYIYNPYKKHIRKPLMHILNVDNGLYEIEVVKNGNVIYRFKKMSDFIKHNRIEFVEDDDSGSESESGSDSGSENDESEQQPQPQPLSRSESQSNIESVDARVETPVDADLTHENVDIHEAEPSTKNDGVSEGDQSEEDDTDNTSDTSDDNLILDPNEYDFVLRNIYFEDEATNTPFGYCLKYETFRKSDMKPLEYTYEDMKGMLSKRRFIGIHLNMDEKNYIINLTTPVNYYLVNNTILDYSFLKMYLFNRYNVILGNTYKLSCIDNFIEMYTIEQGKKIYVKMNTFSIVDDETYNVDESSSCASSPSPSHSSSQSVSVEKQEREPLVQETGDALIEADIEIVECNYIC